jgi:hypothetical protein
MEFLPRPEGKNSRDANNECDERQQETVPEVIVSTATIAAMQHPAPARRALRPIGSFSLSRRDNVALRQCAGVR